MPKVDGRMIIIDLFYGTSTRYFSQAAERA